MNDLRRTLGLVLALALGASSNAAKPGTGALDCPRGAHFTRESSVNGDHSLACLDAQGLRQGPSEERAADGHLKARGRYLNGQMDGQWETFLPNGAKWTQDTYRAGKHEGPSASYYPNARKASEGHYHDDERQGVWREWYENGTPKSAGAYLGGEERGHWTTWHPNGRLASAGEYQGRRRVPPRNVAVPVNIGRWTYWYDNGHKRREGCFADGSEAGIWTEWSSAGEVVKREQYATPPDNTCSAETETPP